MFKTLAHNRSDSPRCSVQNRMLGDRVELNLMDEQRAFCCWLFLFFFFSCLFFSFVWFFFLVVGKQRKIIWENANKGSVRAKRNVVY